MQHGNICSLEFLQESTANSTSCMERSASARQLSSFSPSWQPRSLPGASGWPCWLTLCHCWSRKRSVTLEREVATDSVIYCIRVIVMRCWGNATLRVLFWATFCNCLQVIFSADQTHELMFCLEELTSSLNATPASEDRTMQVQTHFLTLHPKYKNEACRQT